MKALLVPGHFLILSSLWIRILAAVSLLLLLLSYLVLILRLCMMFAVVVKSIGQPPKELSPPVFGRTCLSCSPEEIVEIFRSWGSDCTSYNLPNGNFLALSHQDENPALPRSILVIDDIFCIYSGPLYNTSELRRQYGLSRQTSEAMIIVEAYKVLRDRAPYPPDQAVKELEGKSARDRDGSVQLYWGSVADGSLVCADDPNVISASCGKCYTPFPPGCVFINGKGLISFDHPLNKVRGILREDDEGNVTAVIFQVDLLTRHHSIPRTGSAAVLEGE